MRKALVQSFLAAGALYLTACGGGSQPTVDGSESKLKSPASCTVTRNGTSYTTVLTGAQPNFLYLVEVGGVTDPLHSFSGQVTDGTGTASFSGAWYEGTEIKVVWSEYPHITGKMPVARCSAQ